jgi:hypothetical protein
VSLRTGGSLKEIPVAVKDALNATGTAPIYAARAWVNFDGTTATPTIRASGNVSSVTRNGTGDYTVNFTTAMPDTDYSVTMSGRDGNSQGNNESVSIHHSTNPTTSALRIVNIRSSTTRNINTDIISVAIFR